ncbi:ABC transporter substrate-binding protein [Paenalcaligenes niemegkensis]|uniref:ABC transporter substrate-binding protein n=1 Tax=Paenalcaligenes niemegkensis TaxID=2895469 RepID=UPI001EE8D802|nr:ABC transporter substrate-binding protein [Paenalcaligenes niemegkensis]MCQ9617999.1 ABC transporter substrate-binding protein [Paenalcaligenes niemegkensis]
MKLFYKPLIAATVLAFSPAGAVSAQEPVTLKVATHASLRLLDPMTSTADITRDHSYAVYETLFSLDSKYEPKPQMVGDYSVSEDQLEWVFNLRDGLIFHDGAPVTAEDVVASLKRWFNRDITGGRIGAVTESIEAIDEKSFKIQLSEPYGLMLDSLAKRNSHVPFIMPKRIAETPSDQSISEVIGSGPLRFVAEEFQPGVRVVYEKHQDYTPRPEPMDALSGGREVKVDRVEWISFPDAQTAINALQKGEIDIIERLNHDMAGLLQDKKSVVVHRSGDMQSPAIRLNWLQPPFDNIENRRAALHAINQQDFMDALIGDPDGYKVCQSLFGCDTPLASDLGVVEPDLEKAKELLKQGGYNGESTVVLNITDNPTFQGLAPMTAQVLRSIGMKVDMPSMDFATYFSRRKLKTPSSEGGWSVAFGGWSLMDLTSPIANINLDTRGEIGYDGWSQDDLMGKLKDDFARATTRDEQKSIAAKIQERAYELVFYIPLGNYYNYSAHHESVGRLPQTPVSVYWNIEKNN